MCVSIKAVTPATRSSVGGPSSGNNERAGPRSRSTRASHRENEDRPENEVYEKATARLDWKSTHGDLARVHHELERLDDHIADEDRSQRLARRVACHPVDDPEADERHTHVAGKDHRLVRDGKTEAGEHGRGEDGQRQAEHERGDGADHEREPWTHGGRLCASASRNRLIAGRRTGWNGDRARAPDGDLDRAVRVRPSVRAPSRTCIEPQKPASLRYARRLMRRGDSRVLLIAAVLTIATGLLDYLTPVEVDFTPFYMVPVVLTAWVLGWKAGLAFGVVGAVTEFVADDVMRGLVLATALWNGLSRIGVFFALAVVTDRFHLERIAKESAHDRERLRWEVVDAERNAIQRVLIREFPRPLRALDWFARTFEEALVRHSTDAMRIQFRALRHHIREVTFLGTDLTALGRLDSRGLHLERRRVDLGEILTEAAEASPARTRVLLSLTNEPLTLVADADRLRHAFACLIDRCLELSPHDDVTVLARVSGDEAAVEVNCRAREVEDADVELPRFLVAGNGGRLVLITRGATRGSLVTVHLPLDRDSRKPAAQENAARDMLAD